MQKVLTHYESILHQLVDDSRSISPLWQRGEILEEPIAVQTLADFIDKTVWFGSWSSMVNPVEFYHFLNPKWGLPICNVVEVK